MPVPLSFSRSHPAVVGMVHVHALPGTPRHREPMAAILDHACAEAQILAEAGFDALLVENMHDVPYLNRAVGPEVTAAMTLLGSEVKRVSGLPVGMQILAGANREALAAAHAAGLDFIRAEGFVFSHVADEGVMHACAGELLRLRRAIGAEGVQILADIKKKHSSHAITADLDITETARAAAFFGADGVIVTGSATGVEADPGEMGAVRSALGVPVLVGSGVTIENLPRFLPLVDGLIVGSGLKVDGHWSNPVEPTRAIEFMARVRSLRGEGA